MQPAPKAHPLYAVTLTPHRALGETGIRWVVGVTAGFAAIPGLLFFAMGAWPVVGFLGLEVVLLYWALSTSLKSGRAFEEVTLWRDSLDIRHVAPSGAETRTSFNPFFVRLSLQKDTSGRITAIALTSRERALEVGAFLGPDDKARFASDFGPALSRARN